MADEDNKKIPEGADLARQVWCRYAYMRDHGHLDYVKKATVCENFFEGLQWEKSDLDKLKKQGRPALTINKIISTVSNVMGAQIFNRTDTSFKPRNEGATSEVADALTKVFMQIGDNNDLTWVRSDVFADGIITSRGFYDVRLDFQDSLRGEVVIRQLNPKNVLIDPDADQYNADKWSDVIYTEWASIDDIELEYSKQVADRLRNQATTAGASESADELAMNRDRFGDINGYDTDYQSNGLVQNLNKRVRIIDYQWKKLDKVQHFVDIETGDMRRVPQSWTPDQIAAHIAANPNETQITRLVKRIRWTVVAGDEVLHDDWSPFNHFTIVPYFPHFRRGTTVGLVENLVGSQELLNKTSSQELHVVNTTANSGYFVKRNALQNMSVAELEETGSKTGVVIEVDQLENIQKITPNQTPTGLDRISYKAEEHIKTISGVSDYMTGFSREDVSAKSVKANQAGGSANTAKIQDNLNRSDTMLARVVLDLVQEFYTEKRLIRITTDRLTNATDTMTVNEASPEGTIVNDLTLGEYSVVITNQPDRDTFEETQYDQALRLKTEAGIAIPDHVIIESSKLKNKAEIIKEMAGNQDSPEAKAEAARQQRLRDLEIEEKEADIMTKKAAAMASMAKAKEAGTPEGMDASKPLELQLKAQELEQQKYEFDKKLEFDREKYLAELAEKRYEANLKHKTAMDTADKSAEATVAAKKAEDSAAEEDAESESFVNGLKNDGKALLETPTT